MIRENPGGFIIFKSTMKFTGLCAGDNSLYLHLTLKVPGGVTGDPPTYFFPFFHGFHKKYGPKLVDF